MTHAPLRSSCLALLPIIVLFACPPFAAAESVLWNKTEPTLTLADMSAGDSYWNAITGDYKYSTIWGPNVSITYYTEVTNADTGAVIRCGSSVSKGTRMTFRFIPHTSEHVYWFATGYIFDSPYGDWVDGAQKPYADMCSAIRSKDYVGTHTSASDHGGWRGSIYTSLSVNPPEKTLAISQLLTCAGAGTTSTCTASQTGIAENRFEFGSTSARYYSSTHITDVTSNWNFGVYEKENSQDPRGDSSEVRKSNSRGFGDPRRCYTSNKAMLNTGSGAPYVLQVPAQSISCPITVVDSTNPPTKPVVSSGACSVGSPLTITFVSTDPEGRRLRYGIDWDVDGQVDQYVPSSGYGDSGISQSAGRIFPTNGQKTVRILAQNDQGSDSPWTTHSFSFTCSGGSSDSISSCPSGYIQEGTQCVPSDLCTTPHHCSGNDLVDSCTGATIQTCSHGCSGGACYVIPSPSATLRAIPTLLHAGKTTVVSWTGINVSSCTVTGTNGDSWTGITSQGTTSRPIQSQTTFNLHCIGYAGSSPVAVDKSVIVYIIPGFQEK